jgi:hypothetical protein
MALMVRMLLAQRAAIETLETQIITLKNGGQIKSAQYGTNDTNGKPQGFMIDGDTGNVEFNNGTFDNIRIKNKAMFEGAINSGPLVVDPNLPPISKNYAAGKQISLIVSEIMNIIDGNFQNIWLPLKQGSYNGKNIGFLSSDIYLTGDRPTQVITYLKLKYTDMTIESIGASGMSQVLLYPLSFIVAGSFIQLIDLPTQKGQVSGSLWRDGETVKIVP